MHKQKCNCPHLHIQKMLSIRLMSRKPNRSVAKVTPHQLRHRAVGGKQITKKQKKRKFNQNSGGNSNANQQNASRNQGQQINQNAGGNCKSPIKPKPTVIPKYDESKIPKGLSSWTDVSVDPKVRQLMHKHFELENVIIQSPKGT